MKISSPVGEFPFSVQRFGRRGRRLVIDGRMGAWPSRIEVDAADLPQIVRALPGRPLLAGATGCVAAIVMVRWRRSV